MLNFPNTFRAFVCQLKPPKAKMIMQRIVFWYCMTTSTVAPKWKIIAQNKQNVIAPVLFLYNKWLLLWSNIQCTDIQTVWSDQILFRVTTSKNFHDWTEDDHVKSCWCFWYYDKTSRVAPKWKIIVQNKENVMVSLCCFFTMNTCFDLTSNALTFRQF